MMVGTALAVLAISAGGGLAVDEASDPPDAVRSSGEARAAAAVPEPGIVPRESAVVPRSPAAVPPWSQDVHYRVEARLDEATDVLHGRVRIRYTNNSPDTLDRFYVHQYLNAFRPNSAWARADLEQGDRTFQDLGPDDHAFERITDARIDDVQLRPLYPHAPDSTIAAFELPAPLEPGETITVDLGWEARLSTIPRRQGRRGRDHDFAQWYPRVVVYDLEGWRDHPLYRQGEFYGEFATYDVTLEVREDQVIGATGVAIEGDPGWAAAAAPGTGPVDLGREFYGGPGDAEPLGLHVGQPAPGNRRVRWYAEDVHHFAWSTSPEYIYERGDFEDVAIHVLYRPGDESTWGGGIAAERTAVALSWMDTLFGDYAYPQVTNLHRIEPGGTEFPMVIMDGSASLGLILHEVAHLYAHAILANNEWYEGWLDEGMASFVTAWFFERQGAGRNQWLGTEAGVIDLELRGHGWPVTHVSEDYPEYGIYSTMIYSKGSLILRMLRDMAGEERMIEVLRTYYDRYRLGHVDGDAFRSVAEEVLRRDLDGFFGQWLHANGWVDYSLEDVDRTQTPSGAYRTGFTVRRQGEVVMPVPVRLYGAAVGDGVDDGGAAGAAGAAGAGGVRREVRDTILSGSPLEERAEIETPFAVERVEVDPDGTILDWNGLNDVWVSEWWERGGVERRWIRPLGARRTYRDRMDAAFLPLLWANDAGGVTLGLRRRTNYLGSMHRSTAHVGLPAFAGFERGGGAGASEHQDLGSLYYRVEDPILLEEPRFGTDIEAFLGEGRLFGRVEREWDVSALPLSGPRRLVSARVLALEVYDEAYLRPGRWSGGEPALVEGALGVGWRSRPGVGGAGRWGASAGPGWSVDAGGGVGISTGSQLWVRGTLEVGWEDAVGGGGGGGGAPAGAAGAGPTGRGEWVRRARLFAGATTGKVSGSAWDGGFVPLERRFGVSGAGPLDVMHDPWSRSRGAFLERETHHFGDGGLRGYHPGLVAERLVTLSGEVESPTLVAGPFEIGGVTFLDGGWLGGWVGDVVAADVSDFLLDAGAGVIVGWEDSPLALRIDVPVVVSESALARSARGDDLGFRWAISVGTR